MRRAPLDGPQKVRYLQAKLLATYPFLALEFAASRDEDGRKSRRDGQALLSGEDTHGFYTPVATSFPSSCSRLPADNNTPALSPRRPLSLPHKIEVHTVHIERLEVQIGHADARKRQFIALKDRKNAIECVRTKRKLEVQKERVLKMRATCETALDSISDSKMLRETVQTLSEVKMAFNELDTTALYKQVSDLSESLADTQADIQEVNGAMSANVSVAQDATLEEELEALEAEIEAAEGNAVDNRTALPSGPPAPVRMEAVVPGIPSDPPKAQTPTLKDPYDMLIAH